MLDPGPRAAHGGGGVGSVSRWVLATSNAGKLREFTHALSPVLQAHQIELLAQSDLGVSSAEEPFDTFEDNALAKARHASAHTGLPALADDSGICVAALDGRPGVRSARYWADHVNHAPAKIAQELSKQSTDQANLSWLLHEINTVKQSRYRQSVPPESFWNAAYVASIAFVTGPDDRHPIVVTGRWDGRIVMEPQGDGGFGYDPIFFDRDYGRTAAQLTIEEKQAVSHRGRALAELLKALAIASL